MKKLIHALIVLLCVPPLALGQSDSGAVKVRMLIEEAVASNPRLAANRSLADRAEARTTQQHGWDAPSVAVSWMGTPARSINVLRDHMERRYEVEQMIPFPGKVGAAVEAADWAARSARFSAATLDRSLRAEVKQQYARLQSARRRLEVNESLRSLLRQMISAVESKYSVGSASQADVLRLSIEERKLQNDREALEQERTTAVASLNLLRNRPFDDDLGAVPAYDPPFPTQAAPVLLAAALDRRPDLQGAEAEVRAAQAELVMSKREYLPDLSLGAAYQDRIGYPDVWDVMIGIRIPIAPWSISRTSGRVQEQLAGVSTAERMRDDARAMVGFEVNDLYRQMQTHWQQAERYRTRILPEAEQALEGLRTAYQTGRADFLSLIDSFRMLQMFRMEQIMEQMDYEMTRAELERAVGSDLDTL